VLAGLVRQHAADWLPADAPAGRGASA
jgi:hypothetical protein